MIKLNEDISINLPALIDTRLLVQANSGGGKSWLIRRLLEQSHGRVQQIVIDLEGEFSTLREKHDYILAGKDGDTPAEPRSAALLARRLLELNVSAVVDLYELSHQDRKRFVRLFLSAMVNAPKALWHPCLVVIDEAHVFAPQTGQSEAMESVIDLATRGRKRGYCAILATQRLSKLHKDAVAEMNNKLIGRTGLDIDRKRAAEELGFTTKEDSLSLRNLAPGEFFAFGPAISETVTKLKIGSVDTSHPKAGNRILTETTPPTEKIRSMLSKLADLPKEAQQEAQTVEELKTEVATLRRKNTLLEKNRPVIEASPEVKTITETDVVHKDAIQKIANIISKLPKTDGVRIEYTPAGPNPSSALGEKKAITGGAERIMQVLVSRYPMKFTKSQLALLANLSPRSGTYGTYLSLLRSQNLIEGTNEITLTEAGLKYGGGVYFTPQTQDQILDMWRNNLKGGARRMFDVLVNSYPSAIGKPELGELTEMSHNSGTFGTYLSMLRRNGLVEDRESSMIAANSNLFI